MLDVAADIEQTARDYVLKTRPVAEKQPRILEIVEAMRALISSKS